MFVYMHTTMYDVREPFCTVCVDVYLEQQGCCEINKYIALSYVCEKASVSVFAYNDMWVHVE